MSIRAIIKNGVIQPVEPLPAEWTDGCSLTISSEEVEATQTPPSKEELDAWMAELAEMDAQFTPQDHEELQRIMDEVERESKAAVRKEWGLE